MTSEDFDGIYFDAAAVADDFAFFESLTLTKSTSTGRPELLRLMPFQKRFIGNLLGWKRPDGRRLYRTGFLTMARKNTKTQTIAGLGLDLLIMDNEPGDEIYAAAKTGEQSAMLYAAAADMVRNSEELSDLTDLRDYRKEIRNRATGGVLRALSSEGKSKHGSNPRVVIFDEYHVFGAREKELKKALTTGSGARREPLRVFITTAGDDEQSACYEEYEYAKRVLTGVFSDPTYLPQIHEVPKDADWTNKELWPLANPTLGQVVQWDYLEEQFKLALERPHLQTEFRQLHLNQWVNAASTWIPLLQWDACSWGHSANTPVTVALT